MNKSRLLAAAAGAAMLISGALSCQGTQQPQSEYENAVIEAIMERRSIRQYKDTPVEKEKLELIAQCGINAPNAMNAQQWEVRITDSKEWIDAMTQTYLSTLDSLQAQAQTSAPGFRNMFRNGTALIIVAVKPSGMTAIDAGLMGQNMMLAAHSLGLGTCCLGSAARFLNSEPAAPFLERLCFSEGYQVQYILAVGYPDEAPQAKERNSQVIRFIP